MAYNNIDDLAQALADKSRKRFYNPFTQPKSGCTIPLDEWFMPPELLSFYGTPEYADLDLDKLKLASFYELINLFSITAHGEKILVSELSRRIYSGESRWASEYFHHFLDEENKHMFVFGRYCFQTAGFMYPDSFLDQKQISTRNYDDGEADFILLLKVVMFEMLIDWYNVKIANDERISADVREINALHHQDESRHLAFGRALVKQSLDEGCSIWSESVLDRIRHESVKFVESLQSAFWNKQVYNDAGLLSGSSFRESAYATMHARSMRQSATEKCTRFLMDIEFISK